MKMTDKNANKIGYKKTKLGWIPEDWEMVRFDELFDEVINLSNDTDTYPLYSLTLENGVTPKTERYERSHLLKDKEGNEFKLISKGQIAINPMNLRFGAFFISKVPNTVSLSAYYDIVKAKNDSVNTLFYDAFMKSAPAKRLYQQIATGSLDEKKRVHLSELNKQLVPYPRKKEQEKIAEVLSCWDEGIEILEKLLEKKQLLKKALMQGLLSGKIPLKNSKKNNSYKKTILGEIPSNWTVVKLKNIFTRLEEKNSKKNMLPVLTNSATQGVIYQNEYFDRSIVSETNTNNYYIVYPNAFMYNPRISKNAPAGPINKNKLGEIGIASPLYTIFYSKNDLCNSFYELYFNTNLWNKYMLNVANQGARHDRLNVTTKDFINMPLPCPPINEQQEIVEVLSSYDEEIKLLDKKLEMLKLQKKGLMQKLLTGEIRVKI